MDNNLRCSFRNLAQTAARPWRAVLWCCLPVALIGCAVQPPRTGEDGNAVRPAVDGPGNPALLGTVGAETPRDLPKSRYGNPETYQVFGQQYRVMDSAVGYRERGQASWYGAKFHGRRTSSGEPYNMYGLTAAHKHLPLPTFVHVTNLANGRQLVVKVNDRGPFHEDRIIDLSYGAAAELGVLEHGTAEVIVEALTNAIDARAEAVLADAEAAPGQPGSPTVIQVGAFGSRANAELIQRKVNTLMQVDAAYIVPTDDQTLYRVRFGVGANAPLPAVLALLQRAGIDKYAIMD